MALVLAALDYPGFWVNGDALPVTPVRLPGFTTLDRVAHTPQRAQCLRREARLHLDNIREVLMVKPRSVHRPLNIQASVGSAQENVGNRGHDAGSARRADEKTNLVILQHNDGRHAGQGTLPGSDGVCWSLNQPKHIRRADLRGEVVHLV